MSMASTNYDDDAVYVVKLTRAVDYRGTRLAPLPFHEMTGRALNAIIQTEGEDVVDAAKPR